jgi:hypothetical protein
LKFALTVLAALMLTVQVPVPEQPPPLQPVNVAVEDGMAVKVTSVPLLNDATQVAPQLIPAGELMTVPGPHPDRSAVSAKVEVGVDGVEVELLRLKFAFTDIAALMLTVQVPVPEQPPPLQPVNVAVEDGMAVKVTSVPLLNDAVQVAPQSIPAGELVTVPGPNPDRSAVSTKVVVGGGVDVELLRAKLALTDFAAFIVTMQVPVPEQLPLQPVNVAVEDGMAVKVTSVPLLNDAVQVAPQLIPAGELVTVPGPKPDRSAVSTNVEVGGGVEVELFRAKSALTVRAALMETVQVPVPEQPPPLQPVNVAVEDGMAVKVTSVPLLNDAVQVAPQSMPAGELVTVPGPKPDRSAVSTKLEVEVFRVKLAPTDLAALIVTVQAPVPEQLPLQPVNVAVDDGVAVSVTTVPLVNEAEHVVPHEIPAGLLVTVPVPVPARDTVSVEDVVAPTPVPVASRESVSPSAEKLTLALAAAVLVGENRTVTVWVAPTPDRVKGLPETMLNGAATEAVPVTVALRVPWTVKVCVAELPTVTLPKLTVVVGATVKPACATALAAGEHALSIPVVSTAVTDTLYRVPVVRPVSRNATRWLADGVLVDVGV